jgi:hypothetical protein
MARLKNFSRNLTTSYLQVGVNGVYSLVSVPPIMRWSSKAEFGLLMLPQIAKPLSMVWYFIACYIGIVSGNFLYALSFVSF